MVSATVLRTGGGVYDVELEDGTLAEASLRGRLKLEQRTGDRVVAGDIVDVARQADGSLTIESVAERRSELARTAPGGHGRRAKVIVANVDRVVIVFAAALPDPNRRLLDRFLVIAEANELEPVIILNKTDLVDDDVATAFLAPYQAIGYATIRASVVAGTGVDEVRDCLAGRHSVITGPSGVGKSSLLNAVQPGLGLRVAGVSEVVRKGRHTTVTAQLIPLQAGGYVADTPGLRELGLWGIASDLLPHCFPEFRERAPDCRFSTCTHMHEPACAVREGVESGAVDRARYDSYRAMAEETQEAPRW
ncbi:MAG TPA: ribosome small subunit-dependent GTPase A [Longimicrobiales bacterium]|nr:ribosome small subunit-dependent GTPase A [Longimicrobiales bacterium]